MKGNIPAVDVEDSMTVWNQSGKKYVIERLHTETQALLQPIRKGTLRLRMRNGRTGSDAIYDSTTKKKTRKAMARTNETQTVRSDHLIKHVQDMTTGSSGLDYVLRDLHYSGRSRNTTLTPPIRMLVHLVIIFE